jgi:hypothetical protein
MTNTTKKFTLLEFFGYFIPGLSSKSGPVELFAIGLSVMEIKYDWMPCSRTAVTFPAEKFYGPYLLPIPSTTLISA